MKPFRSPTVWFLLAVTCGGSACSTDSATTPPSGAGGQGGDTSGTAGSSPTGSAGSTTTGNPTTGGTAGSGDQGGAGQGGDGQGGDAQAGSAGSAGGGTESGGGSAGGAGGSAGQSQGDAGQGGTAQGGAAGGTADDKAAAQVLNGYTMLKPCVSSFKPTPNANGDCCCQEEPADENQHKQEHFGGDPSVTYNVTIHVRGVFERYWYDGGMLDPNSNNLFYRGGLPTIHNAATATKNANLKPGSGACKIHPPQTDGSYALPFTVPATINPTDGCFNGFNIFALTVSAPQKSYYLNYTTDYDGIDRQPHKVYKNDYTVTIPITGGATLDFYTIDGDHHEVTNDGTMTIAGVTKVTQPYNGNFVEFIVENVTH